MRTALVILVVAALIGGVLIATTAASVRALGEEELVVSVPHGSVGDRASYVRFVRQPGSDGAPGEWHNERSKILAIERVEAVPDRSGRIHDALVVREEFTDDIWHQHYVDLASGSEIRTDDTYTTTSNTDFTTDTFFHRPDAIRFFAHQGRTFQTGEALPWIDERCNEHYVESARLGVEMQPTPGVGIAVRDAPVRLLPEDCTYTMVPFFGPVKLVTREGDVQGAGAVEGRPALNLRYTSSFDVTEHAFGELVDERTLGQRVTRVRDLWYSSEVPYPLIEQDEFFLERDGAQTFLVGRQFALQTFEAGHSPIPWGASSAHEHWTFERGQDAHHPSEGAGSRLPYPLSRALADLQGPTAPATWRAWTLMNPQAKLVGARLAIGDHSTSSRESLQWSLLFGTPEGKGRELAAERFSNANDAVVRDHGDKETPAYTDSDLVRGQLTFAAAERIWQGLATDRYAGATPNYVHWGFFPDRFASSPACDAFGRAYMRGYMDPPAELHTTYIGHSSLGSCVNAPVDFELSILAIDSRDGEILAMSQMRGDFRYGQLPVLTTSPGQVEPQSAAGLVIAAPDVTTLAAATASLLAIVLGVYFLPVLKVAATQLFLMPGYARVRKEEVLENRLRDQIVDLVKREPGLSVSELAERTGAGWGTVVYHIGLLEKHGLVASRVQGRHRRLFPVGVVDASTQGKMALLRDERARMLYELIQEDPGIIQHALAQRLGVTSPAAYWHLKRLQGAGLVEKVREGRHVRYYPNETPARGPEPSGVEIV